jgi:hypothetical protein
MVFTKDQTRIKLSDWQKEQGILGINNFVSENCSTNDDSQVVVGETVRNAGEGTKKEYRMIWEQLRSFAIYREDYQTATILSRDMCPHNPLPVKPQTLCEFLMWKTSSEGTPLYEFQTTLPVRYRDEDGTYPLLCTGDWKSPGPIRKFRGAINYLHRLYSHLRSAYMPKCRDCDSAQANTAKTFKLVSTPAEP